MANTGEAVTKTYASRVQKVKCGGGLEAWLVEDYTVPLVAFDFAFTAGATNDEQGRAGTLDMMSALLDEGAGDLDADAFHRALDDKAIELGFGVNHDSFSGDLKTLSRHVDDAFAMLALAIRKPRFDDDAIERVRSQMIAGLKREANDPDAMVGRAWRSATFADHPYGREVGGDLTTVAAISRDNILDAHKRLMARGNLKIAAVGAISADQLAELVNRTFESMPDNADVAKVPDVTPTFGKREVIDIDIPQTSIRFSLPGIARDDDDFITAVVTNHILGGGVFSARLFKEVREKRGLAYSVWSHLQAYDHAAVFSGGTSTKNERAAESVEVIEEEIAKLTADGPTEEELVSAKKYMIGSYPLRFDTSTKIAGNLVNLQVEGRPLEFLDQRNDLIQAVTLEDTKRVAKRLFDGKKLTVIAAGRPEGLS